MTEIVGNRSSNDGSPKAKRERSDMKAAIDEVNEERMSEFLVAVKRFERRRKIGWIVLVLGIAIAVQHAVSHSGAFTLPISSGLQDILIGYPTAAGLWILAAISLGQLHPAERKG